LALKVQLVIGSEITSNTAPPEPFGAVFPLKTHPTTLAVPLETYIAPPPVLVETLPAKEQLRTVKF
jgi:hypothetical protein